MGKTKSGDSSAGGALQAKEAARLIQENADLRERLAKFTEASLAITQSLQLETVLNNFLRSACTLTGARIGAIVTFDDTGGTQQVIPFGISSARMQGWGSISGMREFISHLNGLEFPLRVADFPGYARSFGFPGEHISVSTFLSMPVLYQGTRMGGIHLANKEGGQAFTSTDEETLSTFASQAAAAIANARRYEEEQRTKADLEALINISPVGVLVFDAKTAALVSANQEVKRIAGTTQLEGRNMEQVLSEMTVRRADGREFNLEELPLSRVLQSRETIRSEEIVLTLPDGRSISTLVNATPILTDTGEVLSVVVTLQDITPLEDLERVRAQFLGVVSNELRTPLSTIKGSISSLLNPISPLEPTELQQLLRIIDQQTDLMRTQINGLIELTRIQAGTLAVQTASIDLPALVNDAASRHSIAHPNVSVQQEMPSDLPQVTADWERIGQVLQNLLAHMTRNSTGASTVRVSASRDDIFIAVSISSDGQGTLGTELSLLFRRFSPSSLDLNQLVFSGEGLNLAICKGIVEAHGGRIWAGAGPSGHGMTVTFTIPITDDPAGGTAFTPDLPRPHQAKAPNEKLRVLVAVDDPSALRSVRNTLSRVGYTPIAAFSLEDVDRLMEEQTPHVLMLDLSTAGPQEFDLMQRVSASSGVPVIVLSAQGTDDHIVRAFEMGAADYIVKPFSPSELVARIKASLRKRGAPYREIPTQRFKLEDLTIDYETRSVTIGDEQIRLTATEYKVLCGLAASAGRVLTQDELLYRVWGPGYSGESQLLRAHIKTLRQKLGDNARSPTYIFTEHGVGYRMPRV